MLVSETSKNSLTQTRRNGRTEELSRKSCTEQWGADNKGYRIPVILWDEETSTR